MGRKMEGAGRLESVSARGGARLESFDLESRSLKDISREGAGLEGAGRLEGSGAVDRSGGPMASAAPVKRNSLSFARMLESVFGKKE
jgi:hypothetical protein